MGKEILDTYCSFSFTNYCLQEFKHNSSHRKTVLNVRRLHIFTIETKQKKVLNAIINASALCFLELVVQMKHTHLIAYWNFMKCNSSNTPYLMMTIYFYEFYRRHTQKNAVSGVFIVYLTAFLPLFSVPWFAMHAGKCSRQKRRKWWICSLRLSEPWTIFCWVRPDSQCLMSVT